jgi:hypothetical protein
MKNVLVLFMMSVFVMNAKAASLPSAGTVQWVGEIKDDSYAHGNEKTHHLFFVKKDNGEKFNISNIDEVQRMHNESGKNYMVEIEATQMPRSFPGRGNLVVKHVKILDESQDFFYEGQKREMQSQFLKRSRQ